MIDPTNSMTTLTPMSDTSSITSSHHQLHSSYHGMNHMMGHHHGGSLGGHTTGMNHYGKGNCTVIFTLYSTQFRITLIFHLFSQ